MTRRRWFWAVALAAFVGAVARLVWPQSEKAFHEYVAERRAAGLPTTFDELLGPMPPDAENGAADLAVAVETAIADYGPVSSWANSPFDVNMLDPGPDGMTPEQRAVLAVTVTRMRPWTALSDAALAKPRLRFAVKLDATGGPILTHVAMLQSAYKILAMPAQAEDDPVRRLAACRAALLLGHRVEPGLLIDWMVGVAVTAGGATSLRQAVESGFVDATAAREACDELLRESKIAGTRRALHALPVERGSSPCAGHWTRWPTPT